MNKRYLKAFLIALGYWVLLTGEAIAHEGHDDEPTATVSLEATNVLTLEDALTIEAPPLELVARREGRELLIYVDDYASNAPLNGLDIAVLAGERRISAAVQGEGIYRLPADLVDGSVVQSLTIFVRGKEIDTELHGELPAAREKRVADSVANASPAARGPVAALIVSIVLALVIASVVVVRRSLHRHRPAVIASGAS